MEQIANKKKHDRFCGANIKERWSSYVNIKVDFGIRHIIRGKEGQDLMKGLSLQEYVQILKV